MAAISVGKQEECFYKSLSKVDLKKCLKRTGWSKEAAKKLNEIKSVRDFTRHAVGGSQRTKSHFVIRLRIFPRQTFELFVEIKTAHYKSEHAVEHKMSLLVLCGSKSTTLTSLNALHHTAPEGLLSLLHVVTDLPLRSMRRKRGSGWGGRGE